MEEEASYRVRGLPVKELNTPGVDIGDGVLRNAEGYAIRVPKSRLKKQKKEVQEDIPEAVVTEVKESKSRRKRKTPDAPAKPQETVIFSTDLGEVSGKYSPVVDTGDFIVLGLTDQSFIPKSYKEAPNLRLQVRYAGGSTDIVFTGCKFSDPFTGSKYIVLMKVGK